MKKRRQERQLRSMKPVFLVFCEGETEESYINFLRRTYRLPLKVVSKITGQSVSQAIIQRHINAEQLSKRDTITAFLMYDMDSEDVNKRLKSVSAVMLASNPCIELWFLLHCTGQHAMITSGNCIEKLRNVSAEWSEYKKGILSDNQKKALWNNRFTAVEKVKRLPEGANPSSYVYRLIEAMESVHQS